MINIKVSLKIYLLLFLQNRYLHFEMLYLATIMTMVGPFFWITTIWSSLFFTWVVSTTVSHRDIHCSTLALNKRNDYELVYLNWIFLIMTVHTRGRERDRERGRCITCKWWLIFLFGQIQRKDKTKTSLIKRFARIRFMYLIWVLDFLLLYSNLPFYKNFSPLKLWFWF